MRSLLCVLAVRTAAWQTPHAPRHDVRLQLCALPPAVMLAEVSDPCSTATTVSSLGRSSTRTSTYGGRRPTEITRRASAPRMILDTRLLAATVGGTFAGGLHAVTGPDHLAALLPLCMGRRWWIALYTGAYWGLGHGIGAALVGMLAWAVRGALNLELFSSYMEAAVGISMIIGANGIRESQEWATEHVTDELELAKRRTRDAALSASPSAQGVVSTLATGILHGCSGSGHLLGVMPALTMPSWRIATTYLVSFGLGTTMAMSVFTSVVGELSSRMSETLDDPRTPGRLALASSIFALFMGTLWTVRAVISFGWPRHLIQRVALLAAA